MQPRCSSWLISLENNLGTKCAFQFCLRLQQEQKRNKVSQNWNNMGTKCEWEQTMNNIRTILERTRNKVGIFIPTLLRTRIPYEHPYLMHSIRLFDQALPTSGYLATGASSLPASNRKAWPGGCRRPDENHRAISIRRRAYSTLPLAADAGGNCRGVNNSVALLPRHSIIKLCFEYDIRLSPPLKGCFAEGK